MLVYKTRPFQKWAIREELSDSALRNAIEEMNNGLIDANLGSHIYKKRVGHRGKGKSGGWRTIIAYKLNNKAFFIYGFMKNERDNITFKELKALKLLSDELLEYPREKLQAAVKAGELYEVKCDD